MHMQQQQTIQIIRSLPNALVMIHVRVIMSNDATVIFQHTVSLHNIDALVRIVLYCASKH